MGMSREEEFEAQTEWNAYRSGFSRGFRRALEKWNEGAKAGLSEADCYRELVAYLNKDVANWKGQSFSEARFGEVEELPEP